MKRTVFTSLLAVFAIAMVFGVYSCKNDSVNPANSSTSINTVVPDAMMASFDANEFTVTGDETSSLNVYPGQFIEGCGGPGDPNGGGMGDPNGGMGRGGRGDKGGMGGMNDRMGPGFSLRMILWQLKLTPEEITAIQALMPTYHDCVKNIMDAGAEDRKAAYEKAKAAIEPIMAQVKAGTLSRKDAKAQLDPIYKQLKADLDATVDKNALCNCLKTLYAGIRAALTDPAQQTKFDAWVAKQKLPCDTNTPGTGN